MYQEFGSGRQGWYALNQGRGTRKGHKSVSIRQPCWGVRMEWGTGSLSGLSLDVAACHMGFRLAKWEAGCVEVQGRLLGARLI